MEDIKFLRDQYEYERIQNLREILHILEEPQVTPEINFARRFLFSIIRTGGEHTARQPVIIKHTPLHQKPHYRQAPPNHTPPMYHMSNDLQPSLLDSAQPTTPKIVPAPIAPELIAAPKAPVQSLELTPAKKVFIEEIKKYLES